MVKLTILIENNNNKSSVALYTALRKIV